MALISVALQFTGENCLVYQRLKHFMKVYYEKKLKKKDTILVKNIEQSSTCVATLPYYLGLMSKGC